MQNRKKDASIGCFVVYLSDANSVPSQAIDALKFLVSLHLLLTTLSEKSRRDARSRQTLSSQIKPNRAGGV